MANKYKIPPISAETVAAIKRKSAYNLPDRPTERGMRPDEIKHALFGPITDPDKSALAELARVIGDTNDMLSIIEEDIGRNSISVERIEGGHRVIIVVNDVETCLNIMDGQDASSILPEITEADDGKLLVIEGGRIVLKSVELAGSPDLSEIDSLIGEGV